MVSSIHFSNGTTIGLISGGKDSLFALHCCYHFGYKIEVIGHIRHSILESKKSKTKTKLLILIFYLIKL